MKAVTWHGKRDVRVDTVPDPSIQEPDRRDRPHHVDRHLRLRPASLRGARRRSSTRATSSATSRWASSRRSAPRSPTSPGRPRRDPVQHLLRHVLHVRPRPAVAVRDDAGARPGQGRRAVRLHEALRPGARRSGRVAARAAGAVRPDQGARGAARRSLPLPLRRPADRVAGGRVRGHPGGRDASPCSASARSATCARASPSTGAPRGDRHRPRPRAVSRARRARDRGARTSRPATTSARRSAG